MTNNNANKENKKETKTLKSAEQQEKKHEKNKKINLSKSLAKDKFSKNIITIRKTTVKRNKQKEKQNNRRIKKAEKVKDMPIFEDEQIVKKIHEFNTNGKKTICYFIDTFYPIVDGVVIVVDNYAKLLKNKYNIVICAPKHKQTTLESSDFFVLQSDSFYLKAQGYDYALPQLDPVFQRYISLLKIDLIHIHSPFNMGSFGQQLAKQRKIPCVATFHSQYKRDFLEAVKSEMVASVMTKMIAGIYQKADLTLTMNSFSKNLMREYGIKRKIEILSNATSLVKKDFEPEKEKEILKKYKINTKKFNLLFIGRFVKVKNIYFILDVLTELAQKNVDFNMIFMGYGPEMQKMKEYVSANSLNSKVIFTGKITDEDEKAVIIKNSNLLFFPSEYDTDGIVKAECACYSVPSMCIKNSGAGCNIINNENGFLIENNIEKTANILQKLIQNPGFVAKIGKKANSTIYITWDYVGTKLEEYYSRLLNIKTKKFLSKLKRHKM